MTALQVDWGYALSIAGISILTVFILLVILIVVIKIQGLIMAAIEGKSAKPATVAAAPEVKKESANDDEAVMAAIAMALQLHYNSHDEVPGMLNLQPGLTVNTPWCARNNGMNRLNQEK